jgi:hypothetical protein
VGGESGGFVEAEVGFRILVRIHLDLLKEPVDDDKVKVEMGVKDEPKRWRKLTAPKAASAGAVGQASLRVAWRARSRMWRTAPAVRDRWCRKGLRRLGTESTTWRTGMWGKTFSTRWAAVSAMRLALQEGQAPRPLQENATRKS